MRCLVAILLGTALLAGCGMSTNPPAELPEVEALSEVWILVDDMTKVQGIT